MADILFLIIVLSGGSGVKGASVMCDGFVNNGSPSDEVTYEGTVDPLITDSRGAVFFNIDVPVTTTCYAWKKGYTRESFNIAVDSDHTKFTVSLQKE